MNRKTVVFTWEPERLRLVRPLSVRGLTWAMLKIAEELSLKEQAVLLTMAEGGLEVKDVSEAVAFFEEIVRFGKEVQKKKGLEREEREPKEEIEEPKEEIKEVSAQTEVRSEVSDYSEQPKKVLQEEKKELKINLKFGGKRIQY